MIEGKLVMMVGAGLALFGTLLGTSGITGPAHSDVLLALGTFLALTLCRKPRRR